MSRRSGFEIAASGAAGLVFGLGLVVSGMSNPAKVLAFLDLAGPWDPSLALVMAGAIAVAAVGFAFARGRATSVIGLDMRLPAAGVIDRRLVTGAAVFGVGWGLVGLCPGPAFVALSTGSIEAIAFAVAMLAGMALYSDGGVAKGDDC
jgi:uncharacterized membrane protein YedE/YeeE